MNSPYLIIDRSGNAVDINHTEPPRTGKTGGNRMWAMTKSDHDELAAYRALGSVEELKARLTRPLPDDDGMAPMPWADHDPAQEAADGYLDGWDYPDEHQRKRHSGLLEDAP